jgi:integral membrane protein
MEENTVTALDDATTLRRIGFAEGLSYLLLLGIAMPLKYYFGQPLAVRIVGSLHGLLFVLYVLLGVSFGRKHSWPVKEFVLLFLASMLPFGPFFFDRRIKPADKATP